MRTWLKIWSVPIIFLVAWFVLSKNDWNFGTYLFSREMHDEFFRVYAEILGVEVDALPGLALKAAIFDSWIIVAFIAYRKRKVLFPYLRRKGSQFIDWVRGSAHSSAALAVADVKQSSAD